MDGCTVVDITVASAYLECVRHRFLFLSCIEGMDTEHLSRNHAVEASNGVEQRTHNFAHHTLRTSFGVVEENVRHTVRHFTHRSSTNTRGEQVVDGGTVGFAEEFPREGTSERVEE